MQHRFVSQFPYSSGYVTAVSIDELTQTQEAGMSLSVQLSIYPLRQIHLSPMIDQAITIFNRYGLSVRPGAMSSIISGEDDAVFTALKEVYQALAGQGELVIVATLSNACPVVK